MFFVEISGSPYEMGVQAGTAYRLALASTIDLVGKRFRYWDGKRFEAVRQEQMSFTERLCPELIEEVRGIADGSGFPFHLVYLASFYASMAQSNEGCSNIIIRDSKDGPLLAKTNDLPVHEGKHSIVKLKRPKQGYATLTMSWAGTVWGGAGINEAGLAVGGSSCAAAVPMPDECINPHCLTHYILSRAASVPEAIELIKDVNLPPWGANIPMVDQEGNAAVVEKAGAFQGVRETDDDVIWCTNHSLTEELLPYKIESPAAMEESTGRFQTIERLLGMKSHNAESLKEILAYSDVPGALSRYGEHDSLGYDTECSAVFFPGKKKIEICFSHADRDPWHDFSL